MHHYLKASRVFLCLGLSLTLLSAQGPDNDIQAQIASMAEELTQALLSKGGDRPTVAITNFSNVGQETSDLMIGETVSELLNSTFGKTPNLILVERKNIQQVMDELTMQELGITTQSAAEIGRVLGAQFIVVGSVGRLGPSFVVNARILDNTDGTVLTATYAELEANQMIAASSELFDPKKNRVLATFISVIPGAGQFFNDRPLKGLFYMSTFAGALAAANLFMGDRKYYYDLYQGNQREDVENFELAEESEGLAAAAIAGAAAIWAINILDAWWDSGALAREVRRAKKAAQ